jgi:cysteinyl-tRNA synthetase
VDGEKMSKSLGNFTSLDDLLARSDARAYRLLVLRSHYRSPIEVTPETVADAEAGLSRLDELARQFRPVDPLADGLVIEGKGAAQDLDADAVARFCDRMDDDLDTPGALAGLFELVRRANRAADDGDTDTGSRVAMTVAVLCGALGLALPVGGDDVVDADTRAVIVEREAARSAGQWARADELRDQLLARGWVVEDSATGPRVRRQ